MIAVGPKHDAHDHKADRAIRAGRQLAGQACHRLLCAGARLRVRSLRAPRCGAPSRSHHVEILVVQRSQTRTVVFLYRLVPAPEVCPARCAAVSQSSKHPARRSSAAPAVIESLEETARETHPRTPSHPVRSMSGPIRSLARAMRDRAMSARLRRRAGFQGTTGARPSCRRHAPAESVRHRAWRDRARLTHLP